MKETIENQAIDWTQFETKSDDRIKLETGKTIKGLGFCSVRADSIEVEDKEKTDEGTIPVKKRIPTLILGVDYYEGKPVKRELVVTSKRLAQDIRTYFEKNLLFNRLFELTTEGDGFSRKYRLIGLEEKPKKAGAPPASSSKAEAFI